LAGVGLLGGSLGLAIKRRSLAETVAGYVRREASLLECERLGAVDQVGLDLRATVENADLVVLCTPIGQMRELAERMRPSLKSGAIVTDVGSVKGSVVRELEPLIAEAGAQFVGSHPMAGGERTGVAAARSDLFEGAVCAVTPTAQTDGEALAAVEGFWRSIGCQTIRLAPELHDAFVSRTSHLPHVAAAALAITVLDPAHPSEQRLLCANGFRDTTRIASGSSEMWRDIASANRHCLAEALEAFIAELRRFQSVLSNGDLAAVERFFVQAKERRDSWCASTEAGKMKDGPI
jgi:prephenate dehydrogenase